MMVDAFAKERAELGMVTAVSLAAAGGISLALLMREGGMTALPPEIGNFLAVDKMALFFDVVICLGGALSALLAGGYLNEHGHDRGEFYVLIIFSAFGAMILARSVDMLSLFLGLETMSLAVYCMVAFRRTSKRAVEGAMKYFLLGSFAAAILLFGAALLYAATGHTDFVGIAASIDSGAADTRLVLFGMLMVIVGLAFKVSAVPFHMWTPDAYESAVTPATTFMSVAVKSAAFAVFVRVMMVCFGSEATMNDTAGWPPLLAGIAVLSMIYGNIAALAQQNIKRMLAYSSIAHAGYILLGIAAAPSFGMAAPTFHLFASTIINVRAWPLIVLLPRPGPAADRP